MIPELLHLAGPAAAVRVVRKELEQHRLAAELSEGVHPAAAVLQAEFGRLGADGEGGLPSPEERRALPLLLQFRAFAGAVDVQLGADEKEDSGEDT